MASIFRLRSTDLSPRRIPGPPVWLKPAIDELFQAISHITAVDIPANGIQAEATRTLRPLVESARKTIATHFTHTNDGLRCAYAYGVYIDQLIIMLHRLATELAYPAATPTTGEALQILAIGGYGRGALAPYSDIDVLFLLPYKKMARAEQITEFILYVLWDLGLKVGHAVRSVDECVRLAKADMVIRTTLLDMRPLVGDTALGEEFVSRLGRDVLPGSEKAFVAAKVAERTQRLEKTGDSRYRLEPNIKDGKGGLRDLQMMLWVASHVWRINDPAALVGQDIFLPQELRRYLKAEMFLWTVRTHLHYFSGRAEERMTFEVEREIARRLGYTDRAGLLDVERFMKYYFLVAKEVGELNRIFFSAVQAEFDRGRIFLNFISSADGFPIRQDRLAISDEDYFERNPIDLLRIFLVAQKTGRAIHPRAERAISRARNLIGAQVRNDPRANELFLELLDTPRPSEALRAMNEAGILSRFILDWGRVVGQMQYDMYHVYTVDEHTLHVLSHFEDLEAGKLIESFPLASSVVKTISSRRELYLALIIHDIAKGRGGDHSILGEQIALKLCKRLGLTQAQIETVAWLVRWHLAMSDTALKRDLEDEHTINNFAAMVQSPERLRLLLVLTTCDIYGVGPGRWNNWKAGLLSELFVRTADVLSGTMAAKGSTARIALAIENLTRKLADWSAQEIARFVHLGSSGYWLACDAETHARHARLIGEAETEGHRLHIWTRLDPDRAVTEITIYAPLTPLIFSQMAGGIAATGFSIVDAKISPLTNGMMLTVFSVQNASGETTPISNRAADDRSDVLKEMIEASMSGQLDVKKQLARRGTTFMGRTRSLPAAPRVFIDNNASQSQTVIEVNGRDRPGLLYELTTTFSELGLQISSAKISTHGHRVVDVFYVGNEHGKILDGPFLHEIYVRLMAVLEEPQSRAT